MYHLRRATIVAAIIATLVLVTTFVPKILNPTPPSPEDKRRDTAWVKSSPYWLDRQACRWFSVCGIHHMRWDDPVRPRAPPIPLSELGPLELKRRSIAAQERRSTNGWEDLGTTAKIYNRGENLTGVPDYVLRHAPLVHLYSGENFWPSDIAEHVQHMAPFVNKEPVEGAKPLSLANLFDLTSVPGMVYLTSNEDVEKRPEWLSNPDGAPKPFDEDGDERIAPPGLEDLDPGRTPSHSEGTTWYNVDKDHPIHRISDPRDRPFKRRSDVAAKISRRASLATKDDRQQPFPPPPDTPGHKPDASGYSRAPAVLILVDKGSGILDAFWFFFYSYNLGQTVLDMRFGNHVGDWEHAMVRFEHGVPRAVFLSEHEGGQAYAWKALEKKRLNDTNGEVAERPVIYSAVGSHAMYAFPGPHPYVLPFQMLKDDTDRGPLWDPALNHYAYFYDYTDSPPPPEEDEGSAEDQPGLDESSPYPFNTTVLKTHAHRNLTKRDIMQQEPISLVPASSNPNAPTSWFHFDGPWGDELYGLGDERQWRLFGQYHYVTGPTGPKFKRLGRDNMCQTERCRILHSIEEGRKSSWHD